VFKIDHDRQNASMDDEIHGSDQDFVCNRQVHIYK